MAIGGNDVKIQNTDLTQSLSAADFAGAVGSANNSAFESHDYNWSEEFFLGKEDYDNSATSFAGIKEGFSTELDKAIDAYIKDITDKLAELNTSPNVKQGFRGENVVTAINNLIARVDAEASKYAAALKSAEKAIISAVAQAYATHDASISSDISTDASKLEAAAAPAGAGGGGSTVSVASLK